MNKTTIQCIILTQYPKSKFD